MKNNLFLLKYLLLQGKKDGKDEAVARFTGKTRITGKTTKIPERPKNKRETFICDY